MLGEEIDVFAKQRHFPENKKRKAIRKRKEMFEKQGFGKKQGCGDSSDDVGGSPDVSIVVVKTPDNATSELSDQEMHGPRLAQGLAALGELSRAISVLSATASVGDVSDVVMATSTETSPAESSPASAVSPPTSKQKVAD